MLISSQPTPGARWNRCTERTKFEISSRVFNRNRGFCRRVTFPLPLAWLFASPCDSSFHLLPGNWHNDRRSFAVLGCWLSKALSIEISMSCTVAGSCKKSYSFCTAALDTLARQLPRPLFYQGPLCTAQGARKIALVRLRGSTRTNGKQLCQSVCIFFREWTLTLTETLSF